MPEVSGSFEVSGWDEEPFDTADGAGKLTRATIEQRWTGGLDGTATIGMLSAYATDGASARFVGVQRMTGTLDGRSGSFVLESSGDFDGKVARGTYRVLSGTGTGDLAGITGEGSFEAPLGPSGTYRLSYEVKPR